MGWELEFDCAAATADWDRPADDDGGDELAAGNAGPCEAQSPNIFFLSDPSDGLHFFARFFSP